MRRKRVEIKSKPKFKFRFETKGLKVYLLCGVCGLLAVASIFMTIESTTNGSEFASLQKKEAELLAYQQELQQSLVETLSINNLQEHSMELGFSKVSNLVYVATTENVAAKLP